MAFAVHIHANVYSAEILKANTEFLIKYYK